MKMRSRATLRLTLSTAFIAASFAWLSSTTLGNDDDKGDNDNRRACRALPGHQQLRRALNAAVSEESSGLDFEMWATLVNRDGIVCAVAFSGSERDDQWPGSRVISINKAFTANSFSLAGLSLSTANLFSAVQPGGSLFGLSQSSITDTGDAYKGPARNFGQRNDPAVGKRVGGVNTFGGGLGLYAEGGRIVGGIGASGDTSCADHMIAWRVRHKLNLDHFGATVGGVSGDAQRPDNIIYDIAANPNGGTGVSAGGFGHSECINTGDETTLPPVQ